VKAVVLVGGEGTRLRPLTETIPKPLLPFMNRPFLDHVLDHLARHGVGEVICSSPYLESVFHAFLETRRGRPPHVTWITEAEPLGTGGAIAGAREHLGGTFLALNGDILTDLDLGALVAFHLEHGAAATISLTPVDDARRFGLVETEPTGRVRAFREKPSRPVSGNVNAGVYVLEREALGGIPRDRMVSIERETYPEMIDQGGAVYGFVTGGYWRDLGTPEDYLQGHIDALDGLIEAYREEPRPLLAAGVVVDPAAEVGPHVVAGPEVRIGRDARVERSVLHAGAVVGVGSAVEGSVLGPNAAVEDGGRVRDSVLAERARVAEGARLEGGSLRPGEVAPAGGVGSP
jgi:NDP-sugar pyrophosphorylase family protein